LWVGHGKEVTIAEPKWGLRRTRSEARMAIGISPLVDFAFKLMLGNPEHSGITIHFLNSILVGQPRITQVKF
jgi:hypothetical protein